MCFVRVHLFRNTSQACSRRSTKLCMRTLIHANRQTHTCLKSWKRARDGVTVWGGTAGCGRHRPGLRGGRQRCLTPSERHNSTNGEGAGRGCESMTESTRTAVGITSTTLLRTRCRGQGGQSKVFDTWTRVWRAGWATWWAGCAKQRRHQAGSAGLDEQSQMRWWAKGHV